MDPAIVELLAEGAPDDEVAVIIRLADPVSLPAGVRVIVQYGPIVTVRMPRSELKRVHDDRAVRSLKRPRRYSSSPASTIDPGEVGEAVLDPRPGDQRRPSGDLPTGRDVVVAHIDWGVDFAHPDFRDAAGRTRLVGLWDQSARYDPRRPNLYGYGRIYDAADIDRALQTVDPYGDLGYDLYASDPGHGTHGSHTLSIAAGNGRSGGPVGVAPEAKLVFVHLSTSAENGAAMLGDSVALLEAFDFIARVAGPNPLVVNASLGRQAGEHMGCSLTEQGMDAFLLAAPGRAICQSTGNYFDRNIHASGELRPGETRTLHVRTEEADNTPNEVDLWYPGVDRFRITLRAPGGAEIEAPAGGSVSVVLGGQTVGTLYHRLGDPNNGDNEATLFLYRAAPPGEWQLILFGEDVADGRYHAWVERDAGCPHCQAHFAPQDSDPTSTTGTICNGLRTIAVGAYDAHREERPLAVFSSSGPTRDGRQKPDCVAPGVQVLAARSHPKSAGADAQLSTRMSGTSMASPHVTGTIALMFEAAGRPLFIEETRRLLLVNTDPPATSADYADRLRLGSGYLNIEAAVAGARRSGRRLAAHVRRSPSRTTADAAEDDVSVDAAQAIRDEPQSVPSMALEIQVPIAIVDPVIALPAVAGLALEATGCGCAACTGEAVQGAEDVGEAAAIGLPTSDEPMREVDAMNTRDGGNDEVGHGESDRDEAEAERDSWRRNGGGALPFQFQIPIGGGSPAIALPIGGTGSPFAFSVPLGGTSTPVAAAPVAPAAPVPSPASATAGVDAPLVLPDLDAPLYQAPDAADAFGERLVELAEASVSNGSSPRRSASMLSSLFDDDRGPLAFGFDGHRPSATALFNAFVHADHPDRPRAALQRHYARRFDVLARPGDPLGDVVPLIGDVLVRVARGEGWGHIAVVASPGLHRHHRLSERGLRGEGYPLPLQGWHVHVVEAGARPRRADDRFTRRLGDASGVVLGDTLLLRPLGGLGLEAEASGSGDDDRGERPATLKRGATGSWVREAQEKLNRVHADSVAIGLLGLAGAPLAEDGRFDQRTEQAVADFQQQVFGDPMLWSGVLDAATWTQLDAITGPVAEPAPPPPQAGLAGRTAQRAAREDAAEQDAFESAGRPTIRRGSQGATVREAQSKLDIAHARQLAAGGTGLPGCPLVEDGIFGDNTFKATRGLQQLAFPTTPQEWDGVIGTKTWAALDRFADGPSPAPDLPAFPPDAVVDERIDVDARLSLQRLSRGTADERSDAVGLLGTIKAGQLAGIFGDDLRQSAQLAARLGTQRSLLVPNGEDAALVLEPGDTAVVLAPTIVFRGGEPPQRFGIRKQPQRLDAALRKAWSTFVLLREGKLGRCNVAPDGPVAGFVDAEGEPLRVLANALPPLCELPDPPDKPVPPPKPPVKLPPCAIAPTAKNDPSALVLSKVGTFVYSAGTVTTSAGSTLHIRGNAFYPATADGSGQPFNVALAKRAPIVFIAHGNHTTVSDPADRRREFCAGEPGAPANAIPIENHRGYEYFQEQLARMGIVSVSVDCNETNCSGLSPANITDRAELIAASIKHFQVLDGTNDAIFGSHLDFGRVGLFGHSRGAEAVLVVPELTGGRAAAGATFKSVLSLAPTNAGASSGVPRGFAFMTILPAGDGDVVPNFGARFYDKAVPSSCKTQLFVHEANHNFFNREWAFNPDRKRGSGPMKPVEHERILSVYGSAFFRVTLLGHGIENILTGRELPPATRTDNVHLSAELASALTVDDHDDADPDQNTLKQKIVKLGFGTALEKTFEHVPAAFNRSFFGNTTGLVLQRSTAANQFTSPLPKPTDLTGREVWIRCAEIYTGSVPTGATGFKIGLVDAAGTTVFVDSNDAGGLPRPFDTKADDAPNDFTKTMPSTLRFPATCFTRASRLDIRKTKAIVLHLDRADNRALAFDQWQIV